MTLKQSNSIDRYPAIRARHPIVTASSLMPEATYRPSTAVVRGGAETYGERGGAFERPRPSTVLSPIGRRGSEGSFPGEGASERRFPRNFLENRQRHAVRVNSWGER